MVQCFVICLRHRHAYAYTPYTHFIHMVCIYLSLLLCVAWLQLLWHSVCVVAIRSPKIGPFLVFLTSSFRVIVFQLWLNKYSHFINDFHIIFIAFILREKKNTRTSISIQHVKISTRFLFLPSAISRCTW